MITDTTHNAEQAELSDRERDAVEKLIRKLSRPDFTEHRLSISRRLPAPHGEMLVVRTTPTLRTFVVIDREADVALITGHGWRQ